MQTDKDVSKDLSGKEIELLLQTTMTNWCKYIEHLLSVSSEKIQLAELENNIKMLLLIAKIDPSLSSQQEQLFEVLLKIATIFKQQSCFSKARFIYKNAAALDVAKKINWHDLLLKLAQETSQGHSDIETALSPSEIKQSPVNIRIAKDTYDDALEMAETRGDVESQINILLSIADFNLSQNKLTISTKYCIAALTIAQTVKNSRSIIEKIEQKLDEIKIANIKNAADSGFLERQLIRVLKENNPAKTMGFLTNWLYLADNAWAKGEQQQSLCYFEKLLTQINDYHLNGLKPLIKEIFIRLNDIAVIKKATLSQTKCDIVPRVATPERYWQSDRRQLDLIRAWFNNKLTQTPIGDVLELLRKHTKKINRFQIQLMQRQHDRFGPPPSAHAKFVLGSDGRDELCQGSDIEFGIIVGENLNDNTLYFNHVVQGYGQDIISLGETPLKGRLKKEPLRKGLGFDEGGNLPVINGKKALLGTVAELSYIFQPFEGKEIPSEEVSANVMLGAQHLEGDKKLYQELQEEILTCLSKNYGPYEREAIKSLNKIKRKQPFDIAHHELSQILHLPNGLNVGKSKKDKTECIFDALMQSLNSISKRNQFTEKILRQLCFNHYKKHLDHEDQQAIKFWHEKYNSGDDKIENYAAIQWLDEEFNPARAKEQKVIIGRLYREGRILCAMLNLAAIHVILFDPAADINHKDAIKYLIITEHKIEQTTQPTASFYEEKIPLLIKNTKTGCYAPLLPDGIGKQFARHLLRGDLETLNINWDMDNEVINVKGQILRLELFLLNNLSLYYGIEAKSSVNRLKELTTEKIMGPQVAFCIHTLLSLGFHFRLQAHKYYGEENDYIYLIPPKESQETEKRYVLNNRQKEQLRLLREGLLIPVYALAKKWLKAISSQSLQNNLQAINIKIDKTDEAKEVKEAKKEGQFEIWHDHLMFKASAPLFVMLGKEYEAQGQWQKALIYYKQAIELDSSLENVKEYYRQSEIKLQEENKVKEVLTQQISTLTELLVDKNLQRLIKDCQTKTGSGGKWRKAHYLLRNYLHDHFALSTPNYEGSLSSTSQLLKLYLPLLSFCQDKNKAATDLQDCYFAMPTLDYRHEIIQETYLWEKANPHQYKGWTEQLKLYPEDASGNRMAIQEANNEWQRRLLALTDDYDAKEEDKYKSLNKIRITWKYQGKLINRLLKKAVQDVLFKEDGTIKEENRVVDGERPTLPIKVVLANNTQTDEYAKFYPEVSSNQLFADLVTQRISGIFLEQSLVNITILKNNNVYPVQISKNKGKTLKTILRSGNSLSGLEMSLSGYFHTLKTIETMILRFEDEKEDNLSVEEFIDYDGQIRHRLIGIDADHLGVDALLEKRSLMQTEVLVQLKSIALCFKKLLGEMDARAIKTLSQLDPNAVLEAVLSEMMDYQHQLIADSKQAMEGLFKEGFDNDCFNREKYPCILWPVFEQGTLKTLYLNWRRLNTALNDNENKVKTLVDLLARLEPRLADYYQGAINKSPSPELAFNAIPHDYQITYQSDSQLIKRQSSYRVVEQFKRSAPVTEIGKKRDLKAAIKNGTVYDPYQAKTKELAQIHKEYVEITTTIDAIKKPNPDFEQLNAMMSSPYLVEQVIKSIDFKIWEENTQLKFIKKIMRVSLRELSLLNCTALDNSTLDDWLKNQPDLIALKIQNSPQLNNGVINDVINIIAARCGKIEILKLVKINIKKIGNIIASSPQLIRLKCLSMIDCKLLEQIELILPALEDVILNNLPQLKQLRFLRSKPISIEFIDIPALWLNLQIDLSKLRRYILRRCRNIQFGYSDYPELEHLELQEINEETMSTFNAQKLRSLEVSNCKKLNLVQTFSNELSQLNIKNCPEISSYSLTYFASNFMHLNNLHISDCTNILFKEYYKKYPILLGCNQNVKLFYLILEILHSLGILQSNNLDLILRKKIIELNQVVSKILSQRERLLRLPFRDDIEYAKILKSIFLLDMEEVYVGTICNTIANKIITIKNPAALIKIIQSLKFLGSNNIKIAPAVTYLLDCHDDIVTNLLINGTDLLSSIPTDILLDVLMRQIKNESLRIHTRIYIIDYFESCAIDKSLFLNRLVNLLKDNDYEICCEVASVILQLEPTHKDALGVLCNYIINPDQHIRQKSAEILLKVGLQNQFIIEEMKNLLNQLMNQMPCYFAAVWCALACRKMYFLNALFDCLEHNIQLIQLNSIKILLCIENDGFEIDRMLYCHKPKISYEELSSILEKKYLRVIEVLVNTMISQDIGISLFALDILANWLASSRILFTSLDAYELTERSRLSSFLSVKLNNNDIIQFLIEKLRNSTVDICKNVINILSYIRILNNEIIDALFNLYSNQDIGIKGKILHLMSAVLQNNEQNFDMLVQRIDVNQLDMFKFIAEILSIDKKYFPKIVTIFRQYLCCNIKEIKIVVVEAFVRIIKKCDLVIESLIIATKDEDFEVCRLAINGLGKIVTQNPNVLIVLLNVLNHAHEDVVVESLEAISKVNLESDEHIKIILTVANHSVAAIRVNVIQILRNIITKSPSKLSIIKQQLLISAKDVNEMVRREVYDVLLEMNESINELIDLFVTGAQDIDDDVCRISVRALGKANYGNIVAINALIMATFSSKWQVPHIAIEMLTKIAVGNIETIKRLIIIAQDRLGIITRLQYQNHNSTQEENDIKRDINNDRRAAINGLIKIAIGNQEAIAAIKEIVYEKNKEIFCDALGAFCQICSGSIEDIAFILHALQIKPVIIDFSTIETLFRICVNSHKYFIELMNCIKESLKRSYTEQIDDLIEIITALLVRDFSYIDDIVSMLDENDQVLIDFITLVLKRISKDNDEIILYFAKYLLSSQNTINLVIYNLLKNDLLLHDSLKEILLKAFDTERFEVCCIIASLLTPYKCNVYKVIVIEGLQNINDEIRAYAAKSLISTISDKAELFPILLNLLKDKYWIIRKIAAISLADLNYRHQEAIDALIKLFNNEIAEVILTAAKAVDVLALNFIVSEIINCLPINIQEQQKVQRETLVLSESDDEEVVSTSLVPQQKVSSKVELLIKQSIFALPRHYLKMDKTNSINGNIAIGLENLIEKDTSSNSDYVSSKPL